MKLFDNANIRNDGRILSCSDSATDNSGDGPNVNDALGLTCSLFSSNHLSYSLIPVLASICVIVLIQS